uniref:adenylate kinase n=1 Tax=Ananas comosus var. bracteatus TaxID=296719 RepID=A0A6V7PX10_ANACO|nr:unnamed protein product [Ananas comosus var. bracteatus]
MAALHRLLRSSAAVAAAARRGFCTVESEPGARFPAGLARRAAAEPPPARRGSEDRSVQWVFLGCPGVGKGTYASRLSQLLGVPHIATGDLVREELASSGPSPDRYPNLYPADLILAEIVNQGKLVSDEIIINLLSKRLEQGEAKGESGFILDGFPRTVRQAEILDGVTDIDLVINLKLREDVLVEKCLGRRICSQCGGNFNLASIDVKGENGQPGINMAPLLPPAHCMSKLITRADDTEEVVKERLRIYDEKSQPVEEFYRGQGKLLEFDLPGESRNLGRSCFRFST